MKYIVEPQKQDKQEKGKSFITMCWKCGEEPRACGNPS